MENYTAELMMNDWLEFGAWGTGAHPSPEAAIAAFKADVESRDATAAGFAPGSHGLLLVSKQTPAGPVPVGCPHIVLN